MITRKKKGLDLIVASFKGQQLRFEIMEHKPGAKKICESDYLYLPIGNRYSKLICEQF